MKTFIGTKSLKARPMTLGHYNAYRNWPMPANEDPEAEGYLVEYIDSTMPNHPDHVGYISWAPKQQFENAYRDTENMTFGHAVELLKLGQAICRKGWNGRGMFIYYVPAGAYPARTDVAKEYYGDALVPYNPYFAIKNVDDSVSTWVPSINDCLAEDWAIYVKPQE
jgi:hypothetical protein